MRHAAHPVVATTLVATLLILSASGCYTGQAIDRANLASISNEVDPGVIDLETEDGRVVQVFPGDTLVVMDNDGLRHEIPPFTFKVSSTQLLAPEQDLLLGLDMIEEIEISQLSTGMTILVVGVGLAGAGGVAGLVIATAGDGTFD